MSYEPTEWNSGDVVSSQKLNKIENGIANSGLVKSVDMILLNDGAAAEIDCTWQQLYDWMNAGYLILAKMAFTSPEVVSGGGLYHACPVLAVWHMPGSEIEESGDSYAVAVLMIDDLAVPASFDFKLFEAPASDEHPIYGSSEPSEPSEPPWNYATT